MAVLAVSWVITPDLVALAEAESVRLFEVVREGDYPPEWPACSGLVKLIAGGRCEHCGQRRRLAVHHLDRDKYNLQHWNLVALCWERCHLWAETQVSLDRDQLDLFGGWCPGSPGAWTSAGAGRFLPGPRRRRTDPYRRQRWGTWRRLASPVPATVGSG